MKAVKSAKFIFVGWGMPVALLISTVTLTTGQKMPSPPPPLKLQKIFIAPNNWSCLMQFLFIFSGHNNVVRTIVHSPTGPAFLTCSDDFRARFWYRKANSDWRKRKILLSFLNRVPFFKTLLPFQRLVPGIQTFLGFFFFRLITNSRYFIFISVNLFSHSFNSVFHQDNLYLSFSMQKDWKGGGG